MKIKRFTFNYFSENTYIVYDENSLEAAIIDCGTSNKKEEQELYAFVTANRLSVKRLLQTHMHLDHSFGIPYLYRTFGLIHECSEKDEKGLPSVQEQARLFGLNFNDNNFPSPIYIKEGNIIEFGKVKFEIISIPGHSPEGLCFYSAKDNCIFSGDSLMKGSVGRADLWGGDEIALITSIREKLLTLPQETVVYPGHGEKTTLYEEKFNNIYLI